MKLEERIVLFSKLGEYLLANKNTEEYKEILFTAKAKNAWFTLDNIQNTIDNIIVNFLKKNELRNFVSTYPDSYFEPIVAKKIGLIAAGNLPLVGFQDLLQIILSGNIVLYKASSQDEVLILYFLKILNSFHSEISNYMKIIDKLNNADAFIATGSGNSSRYFEYYFASKPHIIRKNRTSIAVLDGTENRIQLGNLGGDILNYFGLGCRNVSKLFVPKGYIFNTFFESIEFWNSIRMHSKYNNNYDYMKAIYLVNQVQHLDNGFLLLKEDENLTSPISVLFYEEYESLDLLNEKLAEMKDNLQVIVSENNAIQNKVNFGKSQTPRLNVFADSVDVIAFLQGI